VIAHQVSVAHIEAMLAAAERYGSFAIPGGGTFSYYYRGKRHCLCRAEDFLTLARVLWEANSVSVRGERRRGPSGGGAVARLWQTPLYGKGRLFETGRRAPSPVETLKLCACYRYQSSRSEDWEASEAAAIVDALEHCAIVALPGYDDAPWEWSR
jgi:hypothetical protein